MLKVTADLYSGRPNPEWIVDGKEAARVLKELAQSPAAAADVNSGFQGLGNRGLIVEPLSDDVASEHGLPPAFRLGAGGQAGSRGLEIAERLIHALPAAGAAQAAGAPAADAAETDKELRQYLLDHLATSSATATEEAGVAFEEGAHAVEGVAPRAEEGAAGARAPAAAPVCQIEVGAFNPGFWNAAAVIGRNNCYNYASNRRTDTFAQPGRASGHMYGAINCAQVAAGAVSDGARQHPSCAPASESPRWYMALVIAPGPGFRDFHWYRKSREGFWGHKPGGTAARNTDNSGRVIYDPRTANRGPYTIFCGFFYAQRRMVVR